MGNTPVTPTPALFKQEQRTWTEHTLRYNHTTRKESRQLLAAVDHKCTIQLAFVPKEHGGISFQHYYIKLSGNGDRIIEAAWKATSKSSEDIDGSQTWSPYGCVKLHSKVWPNCTIEEEAITFNDTHRHRCEHVLGMSNVSLCLRNSEQVVRYILTGKWHSRQLQTPKPGIVTVSLFTHFKDKLDETKNMVKVNTFPSCIRPHQYSVGDEKMTQLYSFLEPSIQFESDQYYLDSDEDTYNILVVGPTGAGKSKLISALFNSPVCEHPASLKSTTQDIYFLMGTGTSNAPSSRVPALHRLLRGKKMVVIDTIGLCDTEMPAEDIVHMIQDRVSHNTTKLHKIYVVLSKNRLVPEFKKSLRAVLQWLRYDEDNHQFFTFLITHCETTDEKSRERLKAEASDIWVWTDNNLLCLAPFTIPSFVAASPMSSGTERG
jgi:nucleoside-triphosphatase THEP1